MHGHCVLKAGGGGVEAGEEDAHFEGGAVEGAPDAAQIVYYVFEEGDSGGLFGVCEADFDEAAADPDYIARSPLILGGATVPEEGEEVLWKCISISIVEWRLVRL